jgi:putative ATP-dependent endonuclease of OLD family
MGAYDNIGLFLENYKSFGAGLIGFEQFASINMIVGRNNSGKSALIDMIELVTEKKTVLPNLFHANAPSRLVLSTAVDETVARVVFPHNASGGFLTGNHWEMGGKHLVGAKIQLDITVPDKPPRFLDLSPNINHLSRGDLTPVYQLIADKTPNPFNGKVFHRVSADRDIANEQIMEGLHIAKSGQGYTSTIAQILSMVEHPTELVADNVLSALNEVYFPDASFTSMEVQRHGHNGAWEIFLNEKGKGRIALSHSGSGLKTILLVASSFIVVPYWKKAPLSKFIFAFEEPENNLHPALQRRLLRYAGAKARDGGALMFVTTHSNVVIDLFSRDKDAQIVHVTSVRGKSHARRVQTYVENCGILDDLDVRASDLLQANGIVWLEGPSDRLYFNRWIELMSDGVLQEGSHYQCVFYGGRLLAHLSAEDPTVDAADVLKILRVNRNAMILIDSDKTRDDDKINATKARILSEVESLNGQAWVTSGREVENYLPIEALRHRFPNANRPPSQFEAFAEYLDGLHQGEGKRFERNKVLFAETVISGMTKKGIAQVLDLAGRCNEAVSAIRRWNGMS